MLIVELIKQIHKDLDVEGFIFINNGKGIQCPNGRYIKTECIEAHLVNTQDTYSLYLQKVVEAINRAFKTSTDIQYIIVVEERYNKIEWFVYEGTLSEGADLLESGEGPTNDLCKEAAIICVLDHIKEKV